MRYSHGHVSASHSCVASGRRFLGGAGPVSSVNPSGRGRWCRPSTSTRRRSGSALESCGRAPCHGLRGGAGPGMLGEAVATRTDIPATAEVAARSVGYQPGGAIAVARRRWRLIVVAPRGHRGARGRRVATADSPRTRSGATRASQHITPAHRTERHRWGEPSSAVAQSHRHRRAEDRVVGWASAVRTNWHR